MKVLKSTIMCIQWKKKKPRGIIIIVNSLPDNKFLDRSKLKQIAEDFLKCILNENKYQYRVENIVRKAEIACYKQFSFSHNVFHSYISLVHQNAAFCGNGLICETT